MTILFLIPFLDLSVGFLPPNEANGALADDASIKKHSAGPSLTIALLIDKFKISLIKHKIYNLSMYLLFNMFYVNKLVMNSHHCIQLFCHKLLLKN